jgi:CheY-like chemotaxis protein
MFNIWENFNSLTMVKLLNILFIEDDFIESMKFKRVLKTLELNHRIIEAGNGDEALTILRANEIIPDIILLDLNMPKLNGLEFLRILKNDEKLRYIPTVIFTTSNNHRDILECYRIGIAGYILKPLKYEDYQVIVKKTLDYWATNELIQ